MKLIIAGTRYPDPNKIEDSNKRSELRRKILEFNDRAAEHIQESIDLIGEDNLELLISGKCKNSPDMLILRFPKFFDPQDSWFPADWDFFGKRAGMLRNVKMAESATHLIAFWDGISNGTKNMIDEAKKRNLMVRVIRFDTQKTFG
jgi:hypothetical protein